MTQGTFDDVRQLGKSWSQSPDVEVAGDYYRSHGFDRSQRVFRFERLNGAGDFDLTLHANNDSPLYNIPLVIEGWGDRVPVVALNGQPLPADGGFRYGIEHTMDGADLVIWVPHMADSRTTIRVSAAAAQE